MAFFGFLARKKFYVHFGLSILLTLVILLLAFKFLRGYTRHGELLVMPDFSGKTVESLEMQEYGGLYGFVITDSVYDAVAVPGSIVKQNPSPGSRVKEGRKVYVTVVAMMPEMTLMPDLRDLTLRQAVDALRTAGLKVRSLVFAQDIADNAVLDFYYNGSHVSPGTELQKGSRVDLLVGSSGPRKTAVPFLVGLTQQEALDKIHASAFNAGFFRFLDGPDDIHSRVYRQSPGQGAMILQGDTVNLWFRSDLKFNFERYIQLSGIDTLASDTTFQDTEKEDIF
jgi:beta-lactam-binding protein with PASTA domain